MHRSSPSRHIGVILVTLALMVAVIVVTALGVHRSADSRGTSGVIAAAPVDSEDTGSADPDSGASQPAEPADEPAPTDASATGTLPTLLTERSPLAEVIDRIDLDALHAANPSITDSALEDYAADPAVWVDHHGRLYYIDEMTSPADEAVRATSTPPVASTALVAPLDQTFELQSRPGSRRTIYLDVLGGTVTNTFWNDKGMAVIPVAPWDRDGSPQTFDAFERALLQQIWAMVAEDFAPFDVNVTTKDLGADALVKSGAADETFGMRAKITNDRTGGVCSSACSGIAYIDVFTKGDPKSQPAWVFAQGSTSGYIAQTISHEVGHTFGLHHDGHVGGPSYSPGQGLWATIMGGGKARAISQWSIGDYASANNTEDDVSIIASHGAPLIADDAGGTIARAKPLDLGSTRSGLISTRADVDVYAITVAAGALHLQVDPARYGPNLDIRARLLTADGTVLRTSAPRSAELHPDSLDFIPIGMSAFIDHTVASPTTLYLEIQGVGNGDPKTTGYSDYGSIGAYTISGSRPTLTVGVLGSGTVASTAPTITCTASCTTTARADSSITLTATPAPGQALAHWIGPCESATGHLEPEPARTCTVKLDQSRNVVAHFRPVRQSLTLTVVGPARAGTVRSSPAGIDCIATCSGTFAHGTRVTLTASPATGHRIVSWGGDCTGTATTCTLTLNSARRATVTFAAVPR